MSHSFLLIDLYFHTIEEDINDLNYEVILKYKILYL